MNHDRDTIFCPSCEKPLLEVDVDWGELRGRCQACDLDIVLSGFIEPPGNGPESRHFTERAFRVLELPRPDKMKLKRTAFPGIETFELSGAIAGASVRLERENLVFKGLFGRERVTPLSEVLGFAALQHVSASGVASGAPGSVTWRVGAALESKVFLRLWEYERRDHARYLASELNKVLRWMRTTETPYRD